MHLNAKLLHRLASGTMAHMRHLARLCKRGTPLAACWTSTTKPFVSQPAGSACIIFFKLEFNPPSFNSAVMVVNVEDCLVSMVSFVWCMFDS